MTEFRSDKQNTTENRTSYIFAVIQLLPSSLLICLRVQQTPFHN